jgi:hypothetical protein
VRKVPLVGTCENFIGAAGIWIKISFAWSEFTLTFSRSEAYNLLPADDYCHLRCDAMYLANERQRFGGTRLYLGNISPNRLIPISQFHGVSSQQTAIFLFFP